MSKAQHRAMVLARVRPSTCLAMCTAQPASRQVVLRRITCGLEGLEGRARVCMRRCISTCIGGMRMFAGRSLLLKLRCGDVRDAAAPPARRLRSWRPEAFSRTRSSSWRPRTWRCWSARVAAPRRPATARRPAQRSGLPVLGQTVRRMATARTGRSRVRRRPGQKKPRWRGWPHGSGTTRARPPCCPA
jgi:hypothetical protein